MPILFDNTRIGNPLLVISARLNVKYYKEIGDFDFVALGQKAVWLLADACNAVACFEHGSIDNPERIKSFSRYLRLSVFSAGSFGLFTFRDSDGETLCDDKAYTYNNLGKLKPNTLYCHVLKNDALNALSILPGFDLEGFMRRLSLDNFVSSHNATKSASARWGNRKPMVDAVENYVVSLLECGCMCDHAQVKDYAWKHFQNDQVVKLFTNKVKATGERDYSKFLTKGNLIVITRTIFEDKASDRIFKVSLHTRSKACPIHF